MKRIARTMLLPALLLPLFTILSTGTVYAQTPTPSPTDFSAQMVTLLDHARELMPFLRNSIEAPLLDMMQFLAELLGGFVMVLSFARVWRESEGAGKDLFFWFIGVCVVLALYGSGPIILQWLHRLGEGMTGPAVTASTTQEAEFAETYSKFLDGQFTVKPPADTEENPLGVLWSGKSDIKDVEQKLNVTAWSMPNLFFLLNVSRSILTVSDVALVLLGGFIMIGLRLASPFMIAVAIDRNTRNRLTYPFAWAAVVFTLVYPQVREIIRFIAYTAGNLALEAGTNPAFKLDPGSLQVLYDPALQPVYIIIFGIVVMLLASLSMFSAPYISYKLASGQVFEGVSSVVSGWTAGLVGTAIEVKTAVSASALNNQADRTQISGGYQGEVSRAGGALEAGNLAVRARQIAGIAQARGGQSAALGQIFGARAQAVISANAGKVFGISSAQATAALSKSDIAVRANQSINDSRVNQGQQKAAIEVNRDADTQKFYGDKAAAAGDFLGREIRGDKTRSGRNIAGSASEVIGSGFGLYKNYQSIQDRAAGQAGAVDRGTEGVIQNQRTAAQGLTVNQETYLNQMTDAHTKFAEGQIAAASSGASEAAGGVNRGIGITIGGINKGAELEKRSNTVTFDSQIKAAGQVRDAAIEAANMRAWATAISSLGHTIARKIESGLPLRY